MVLPLNVVSATHSVNRYNYILFLLLVGCSSTVFAQVEDDPKNDNFLERKIENIAENSSEDVDYTTLFENLAYFREHPLDLNFADADELSQLLMLNDFQIAALIRHREKYGKLLSIYELQSVEGFDLPLIYQMLPFVKVDRELNRLNINIKDVFRYGTNDVFMRLTQTLGEQKGFSPISDADLAANPNARYLGSPQRIFMRYRFKYSNRVSAGFTGEKDAGEEFFKGSQKQGFDFMSAHVSVQQIGKMRSLNIGDYQAHFGQGLTFWSGFAFGKTADALNVKRSGVGLKPYTSVNENLFLRGIASAWQIGKRFEITGFYSDKKVNTNASEADSLSQDILAFSNFNLSGFHRTPGELQDKGNIREQIAGGHITYRKRNLNIGLTAAGYQYSAAMTRTDKPYNKFEFQGKSNYNIGIDYNWVYRNFNFFGETARSANGAIASTNGLLLALDPRLTFSFLQRNFARDYQVVYGAAIAEGSRNINERGTYIGMVMKPYRYVSVSAFYDRWKYPWLRYLVDAPSTGHDGLLQINYTPSKTTDMYFRYRERLRAKNTGSEDALEIDYPVHTLQRQYRFDLSYKISPTIRLRNRFEAMQYKRADSELWEQGFLVMQDIYYRPIGIPIALTMRYALFNTDSYNARIYAYENDVLYSFSIPAYSDKGSRFYCILEYSPMRNVDIWLRFAQFYYLNKQSTGSGMSEIQGPARSDFRVQVRVKF
ncbi:MAG: helix-hairpin-helix domain-containing protein [Bacteroidia bacterium]|nr:helix-hairpin-helix domain-containing protein [Bacteroidia bacterium]